MKNVRPVPALIATGALVLALVVMFGVASLGFVQAGRTKADIEARQVTLANLSRRVGDAQDGGSVRNSTNKEQRNAVQLPASTHGVATARLQSRIIETILRAGGQVGSVQALSAEDDAEVVRFARAVQQKIARDGLKPRHTMRKNIPFALRAHIEAMERELEREAQRIAATRGRG